MKKSSRFRKNQPGVNRLAVILITLWTSSIVALAACDSKKVEKFDLREQRESVELEKTVPKQRADENLSVQELVESVKLSVGITVEPYVIRDKDSGFEVDIVREAFALGGYSVKFVYEPLERTKISFVQKRVDGVMDVKKHYPEVQGAFLSDEFITYYNFAVTLQSQNLEIHTIADLADKKVIAFQQARIAFGKEFEVMANNNPEYSEMANQKSQIAMLFLKRVDVIVLDRRIFKYHRIRLTNVPTEQPVTYHELFEPSSFRIAFNDRKLLDVFNRGLRAIKISGRYREIIDSYLEN